MALKTIALVLAALAAGGTGAVRGSKGVKLINKSRKSLKVIQKKHDDNVEKFEAQSTLTNETMDKVGTTELEILNHFEHFSDLIEKIQNRPEFEEYDQSNVTLPSYNLEDLEKASAGASILLGGIGSAASGTAGGFAAAGATKAAVMALGTASTGVPIASLNGAALTNATLAALGGGSLAAGGGGIALGTVVLNAATLGVGILVGGEIVRYTSNKLSKQTKEAMMEMLEAEIKMEESNKLLEELNQIALSYLGTLTNVYKLYKDTYNYVHYAVNNLNKTDWRNFSKEEKTATHNLVLLVGLLYKMCQVELIQQSPKGKINTINEEKINKTIDDANDMMNELNK